MGLESGVTYITDLDATNPVSGDNVSQGYQHLQIVKTALGGTFNSFTGDTTDITEAELQTLGTLSAAEVGGIYVPCHHSSYKATETVTRTSYATPGTWTEDDTAQMNNYNSTSGLLTISTTGMYQVRLACYVRVSTPLTFSFGLSLDGADPTGRWEFSESIGYLTSLAPGFSISIPANQYYPLTMQGIYSATAAETLEFQSKVSANTATVENMEFFVQKIEGA